MDTTKLTPEQRRLVERAMPRVESLARALAHRLRQPIDELRSAGFEGLVHAASRYDPRSGIAFATFAHYRARGAMIDAARSSGPQVRRLTRALRTLETTQALLTQVEKAQPRPEVVDPRSLAQRVEAAAAVVAQTTTAVILSRMATPDPDAVAGPSADAESALLRGESAALLKDELAGCSEEERDIIDALYNRGLSMAQYAAGIGKSKSTVSRHHARLLARLGSRLRRRLGG